MAQIISNSEGFGWSRLCSFLFLDRVGGCNWNLRWDKNWIRLSLSMCGVMKKTLSLLPVASCYRSKDWTVWKKSLESICNALMWTFLKYLALDVTAYCICKIHCLALEWFNLNTVHKLSGREEKSRQSQNLNPGLLGWKQSASSAQCSHSSWCELKSSKIGINSNR